VFIVRACQDLDSALIIQPVGPRRRRCQTAPIESRLDAPSGMPTHLQLGQQVEHALLGYLKPDGQLPKVWPGATAGYHPVSRESTHCSGNLARGIGVQSDHEISPPIGRVLQDGTELAQGLDC
jgi:hypothetical protein